MSNLIKLINVTSIESLPACNCYSCVNRRKNTADENMKRSKIIDKSNIVEISQLYEKIGVNRDVIRRWEQQGRIPFEVLRHMNGKRYFTPDQVKILKDVKNGLQPSQDKLDAARKEQRVREKERYKRTIQDELYKLERKRLQWSR